jgi:type III secretory pathway lipoprotein EscJ
LHFKNGFIAVILLVAFLCCSGCGTVKGVVTGLTQGLAEDTKAVAKGIGVAGEAVAKGDQWFRENLW